MQLVFKPEFYSEITEEMDQEWMKNHMGKRVNETVKDYVLEYFGQPIHDFIRYVELACSISQLIRIKSWQRRDARKACQVPVSRKAHHVSAASQKPESRKLHKPKLQSRHKGFRKT